MDSDINFKDLWQKQKISPANMDDLLLKLNQYKKVNLRKLILSNFLLLATSAFIVFIWYNNPAQLLTTKIGIVLVILAMLIFLFVYNQLFPSLKRLDSKQSNNNYLQNLITVKTKQQFLQSKILRLYFIMISTGVFLFMYEYALKMPTSHAFVAYTATLAWIGFNWFYIRPKTIIKQEAKLDELIKKIKAVNQQLSEE